MCRLASLHQLLFNYFGQFVVPSEDFPELAMFPYANVLNFFIFMQSRPIQRRGVWLEKLSIWTFFKILNLPKSQRLPIFFRNSNFAPKMKNLWNEKKLDSSGRIHWIVTFRNQLQWSNRFTALLFSFLLNISILLDPIRHVDHPSVRVSSFFSFFFLF